MKTSVDEAIEKVLPELVQLRHELHRNPELSGKEEATAHRLKSFLQKYMPKQLLTRLGSGTGLAAVYEGREAGPTLMLRADMDALPITEANGTDYCSQSPGVSHKCGHDGHVAMVAGIAPLLHRQPLKRGRVVLFMQPAEETGQGARSLLDDAQFRALKPDYIFGLHNLPSYPMGQVVLREGTFCAASKGLRVQLSGQTAHAAEPERGLSPANALSKLLQTLPQLPRELPHTDLLLLTITYASLGEPTFGTSPGEAVLQLTLRANQQEEMDLLSSTVEQQLKEVADAHGLSLKTAYHEVFTTTTNSASTFQLMHKAAKIAGLDIQLKDEPFRWSEDFGYYNELAPAGFFGLGSGLQQPNLHHPDFDFPDELIPYGLTMYQSLIQQVLGE